MTSPIAWKAYDEEYKLSEILTEAARSCVSAKAARPTDFFVRYFREVAGGDAVESLNCHPNLGADGDVGLRIHLRLLTGAQATTTALPALFHPRYGLLTHDEAAVRELPSRAGTGSMRGTPSTGNGAEMSFPRMKSFHVEKDGAAVKMVEAIATNLTDRLLDCAVAAQPSWDGIIDAWLAEYLQEKPPGTTYLPYTTAWALSLVAAMASAENRSTPLYRYTRSLYRAAKLTAAEMHRESIADRQGTTAKRSEFGSPLEEVFSLPQLVLPFLICDANVPTTLGGAQSPRPPPTNGGQVLVYLVYLLLDPLVYPPAGEVASPSATAAGAAAPSTTPSVAAVAPVVAAPAYISAMQRIAQVNRLHEAVRRFRERHSGTTISPDGLLRWPEARNISDILQVTSEILKSVGLTPGVDVAFGVSLASLSTTLHSTDGAPISPVVTSARDKKNQAEVLEGVTYDLFAGEPPVSGEQLTEYLCEQIDPEFNALQLIEDSHQLDDIVPLYRLQQRLQETLVVSAQHKFFDCPTGHEANIIAGAAFTASVRDGVAKKACSNVAVEMTRCGSLSEALRLAAVVQELHGCSLSVVLGASPGDVAAIVDTAVGAGAQYIVLGGLLQASTATAITRYISIQKDLEAARTLIGRAQFVTFNRVDLPALPEATVAAIRRRSDKNRKKDARKAAAKKK